MKKPSPEFWRGGLTLALLLAATLVFHARGLRPGYAFLPIDNVNLNRPWRIGPYVLGDLQNPLIGDPIYQFYPFLVNAVEAVQRGEWPLWHSRLLLGHPLAGDPLAQTFYPVFLSLGLGLGPARGLTLGFWLHAVLAAGLTYGWLRALGARRAAAVFGALTYALGGYMVTWFETTFWVSTLSWLPGVLWMFDRAWQRRQLRYLGLAGLALGLATLAGQISFALLFMLFFALYAVGRAVEQGSANARAGLWPLGGGAAVIALGLLLSAPQTLTLAEVLALSHRAVGSPVSVLPWPQVITWLAPDFYGNPSTTGAYWGALNYSEGALYAGVAALTLALLAPLSGRRWSLYLFSLGLAFAYFAFGGPGSEWVRALPGLSYQPQHRAIFLLPLIGAALAARALCEARLSLKRLAAVTAALLALAGWALAADWGQASAHRQALAGPLLHAGGFLAAAVLSLWARERWPAQRGRLDWALAALAFADLFLAGSRYNPALPVEALPAPTPAIEFLQAQAAPYRVLTRQAPGEFVFGLNYLTVFGVPDLSGYSSLLPAELMAVVRAGDPASGSYNANTVWFGQPTKRLVDLLQARYVVSTEPLGDPGLRVAREMGDCSGQTAEVQAGQPATASLMVRDVAINRLDVAFRAGPALAPEAALTVRMWQGEGRQRLVLESAFTAGQARDQGRLSFYFAVETDAPGSVYVWEISTPEPETGLRVCAQPDGAPDFAMYGADWAQAYAGELFIAERLAPLPRAFVVYAAETLADEAQAAQRLLDEAFDLRQTAIIDLPTSLPAQAGRPARRATLEAYGDTRVVIRAFADEAGLLVLGDAHHPGWTATIDGQPAPVQRVNLLWRGVPVPAGEHEVVFTFAPLSLQLGLALGGAGAVGVLALLLLPQRRRDGQPQQPAHGVERGQDSGGHAHD